MLSPVDRQTKAKRLIVHWATDDRAGEARSGGHGSRTRRRSQPASQDLRALSTRVCFKFIATSLRDCLLLGR